MSEFAEKLWPDEETQPVLDICIDGENYQLEWDNTWIQRYRTGRSEFDEELKKYDHILHRYAEDEEGERFYVIFTFGQIGEDSMRFLVEKSFAQYVNPIPDPYALEYIASRAKMDIPDALPPEFGASAA